MEIQRMRSGSKPSKITIQVVAQQVAAPQYQNRDEGSEMRGFVTVVVVDEEEVHDAAHRATHAERAEDERPEDLVEKVGGAGHHEYSNGEEKSFGYE